MSPEAVNAGRNSTAVPDVSCRAVPAAFAVLREMGTVHRFRLSRNVSVDAKEAEKTTPRFPGSQASGAMPAPELAHTERPCFNNSAWTPLFTGGASPIFVSHQS